MTTPVLLVGPGTKGAFVHLGWTKAPFIDFGAGETRLASGCLAGQADVSALSASDNFARWATRRCVPGSPAWLQSDFWERSQIRLNPAGHSSGGHVDLANSPSGGGRAAARHHRGRRSRHGRTPRRPRGSWLSVTPSPVHRGAGARCSGNTCSDTGHTDVDFVGSLPAPGCGFSHDGENEGHGGILATNIVRNNQLPGWLSSARPDIVLMHLGTNDVWSNIPASTILDAYSTMLGQMRAGNPADRTRGRADHPDDPGELLGLRPARGRPEQRHSGLGAGEQHGGLADHRRRPVDGLRHRGGHHRRRAPQRFHRHPEDGEPAGIPPVVAALRPNAAVGLHVEGTRVVECERRRRSSCAA